MQVYDAKKVARMERLYSSRQVVEQRARFRAAIAARPGEQGLDIGCGAGYLTCELAREVAPGGRITAIDASNDSEAAATARVAKEGLAGTVEVRAGDAASLPFSDGSFDFVVGVQVYCYVPDIAHGIREAARVLRKGGRLLILESDWDTCVWETSDHARTRRMLSQRASRFAHAHLPRELPRLIKAAGMALVEASVFPILETRYDASSYGAGAIDSTCEAAIKSGIPAEEVSAWEADLRSRVAEGEWFFCLNRFIFAATKI